MPMTVFEGVARFTGDVSGLVSASKQAEHVVMGVGQTAERESDSASKSFLKMGGAMAVASKGIDAALRGLKGSFGFVKGAVFDFNAQVDQAERAFTRLTGSTQLAKEKVEELKTFSKKTPFEFKDVLQMSQYMSTMGFEAKELVPAMTSVGDAVSAMRGGRFEMERVIRALGQMRAKGKVSAEEMMQLSEVNINGWKYLAEASGKSIAEVQKAAEKGQIDANAAIKTILAGMGRDFQGEMDAMSRTLPGAISNIKDIITQGLATAGRPIYDLITKIMVGISDLLMKSAPAIEAAAQAVAAVLARGIQTGLDFLTNLWDVISPGVMAALGFIGDAIGFAVDHWTFLVGGIFGAFFIDVFNRIRRGAGGLQAVGDSLAYAFRNVSMFTFEWGKRLGVPQEVINRLFFDSLKVRDAITEWTAKAQEFSDKVKAEITTEINNLIDRVKIIEDDVYKWVTNTDNWRDALNDTKKVLDENKTTVDLIAVSVAGIAAGAMTYYTYMQAAAGLKVAVEAMDKGRIAIQGLITMAQTLGPALGAALAPLGSTAFIVAAVVAVIAALTLLYFKNETFREAVNKTAGVIKDVAIKAYGYLRDAIQWVIDKWQEAWPYIKRFAAVVADTAQEVWGWMKKVYDVVADTVTGVIEWFQRAWDKVTEVWNGIMGAIMPVVAWIAEYVWPVIRETVGLIGDVMQRLWQVVQYVWGQITQAVGTAWAILEPILHAIAEVMEFAWDRAAEAIQFAWLVIQPILQVIGQTVGFLARIFMDVVVPAVVFAGQTIQSVFEAAWPVVQRVFGIIKGVIEGVLTTIRGVIEILRGIINGDFKQVWEGLQHVVEGVVGAVWTYIKGVPQLLWDGVKGAWHILSEGWSNSWDALEKIAKNIGPTILKFLEDLPNTLLNAASNIGKFILDQIWGGFKGFFAITFKVGSWIIDHLSQIPGQIMNMLMELGKNMIEWIVKGIANGPSIAAAIGDKIGDIPGLGAIPGLGGIKPATKAVSWLAGERAAGGPVTGGGAYLVGEKGPELFVPSYSGTVIPNDALTAQGFSAKNVSIDVSTSTNLPANQITNWTDSVSAQSDLVDTLGAFLKTPTILVDSEITDMIDSSQRKQAADAVYAMTGLATEYTQVAQTVAGATIGLTEENSRNIGDVALNVADATATQISLAQGLAQVFQSLPSIIGSLVGSGGALGSIIRSGNIANDNSSLDSTAKVLAILSSQGMETGDIKNPQEMLNFLMTQYAWANSGTPMTMPAHSVTNADYIAAFEEIVAGFTAQEFADLPAMINTNLLWDTSGSSFTKLNDSLLSAFFGTAGVDQEKLRWVQTWALNSNWGDVLSRYTARRAKGGPIRFGQQYMIGEEGPELFTAGVSGYVTPLDDIFSSGRGGGDHIVIQIHVGKVDSDARARQIGDEVQRALMGRSTSVALRGR